MAPMSVNDSSRVSTIRLVMKRRKVLYIVSDIDKALHFEWIADKLDQSSFELCFILLLRQPAYLTGFLKERGIPCHCIYFKGKMDFPRIAFRLLRLFWSLKPHVVHCHLFAGAVLGLFAAKLTGVRKRIYTLHHSDYHTATCRAASSGINGAIGSQLRL